MCLQNIGSLLQKVCVVFSVKTLDILRLCVANTWYFCIDKSNIVTEK